MEAIPSGDSPTQTMALFRDVKTADAVRAMSPKVRNMFLDAGFGLIAHESDAPEGFYPSEDGPEREQTIRRLFNNIREQGIRGEYCGEFDFEEFLEYVKRARPATRFMPAHNTDYAVAPKRRPIPGRIGFALGIAVLVFVVLKYLEETGMQP